LIIFLNIKPTFSQSSQRNDAIFMTAEAWRCWYRREI